MITNHNHKPPTQPHSSSKTLSGRRFTGFFRKRFAPKQLPVDDRGRMRMVIDTLVFHIHPPKAPIRTLKWSFAWGLGGMAAVLFGVLTVIRIGVSTNRY